MIGNLGLIKTQHRNQYFGEGVLPCIGLKSNVDRASSDSDAAMWNLHRSILKSQDIIVQPASSHGEREIPIHHPRGYAANLDATSKD